MPDSPSLRDFGVLPGGAPLPSSRVRSEMSGGQAFGQYLMSALMALGCGGAFCSLGIMFLVLGVRSWGTRDAMFLLGAPLFLVMGAAFWVITAVVAARSNRWVELDGEVIRAKNLYTGRITERPVWTLTEITTEVFAVATVAIHLTEALQGRVRGFALKFPDLPRGIRVYRPEMRNVQELIEAIVARLETRGQVVPEIIQFEGRPMIRRLLFRPYPGR